MRDNVLIIDADAHVSEPLNKLRASMKEEFQHRPISEGEGWDRTLGGRLGKHSDDPQTQLADMDVEGIDIQVLYPSSGLSLGHLKEAPLAVERARTYNDWLAEFCSANPDRLKGAALVALQDVKAAIKEAERAVKELGFVSVIMPTNVLDQDIGLKQFWPFYEAIQDLGVGLSVHGGIHMAERMHGRFDTFIKVHTVAFPFECMAAVTGLIFSGVPEVFPNLRMAILEGNCGWIPFLMDRMDEEFELRGWREAPLLKAKPSEYLLNGRFVFGFEVEESTIPYIAERIGADKLMFASDYPHWDSAWPHSVEHFMGRDDLTVDQKRQIMQANPQAFYNFTARVPATVGSA